MKIRRMIGDVLAVRIKDPDTDKLMLEIKTDGRCQLMHPDIDRAHQLFYENFEIPKNHHQQIRQSMQQGKFDSEYLHLVLTKQFGK